MTDEKFLIEDGVLVKYIGGSEEQVVVPDGVTAVGDRAFARCDTVAEIILPDSVVAIGERAFMECGWLTKIVLPDSLEFIDASAFRRCDSLEAVYLPDSLKMLPVACFYECANLKSVRLPAGIKQISPRTFYGCSGIEAIVLPEGLTEIEECAFEYCTSLCSVKLPDSLTAIGRHAFARCYELSDINIPAGVKSIGCNAFHQTAFIENTDNGFVIGGDGILISCAVGAEHITVPAGIKMIGEMAFAYNDRVQSVKLPDGVIEICSSAFERCTALSEISLPDSLRIIGDRVFEECSSLEKISLPDGVTQIGSKAFEYTPIEEGSEMLILNDKYLIAYHGEEEYPQIPDTVEVIAGGAFSGNTDIKSVSLGGKVRFVCREAFRWCRELEEVHISAAVQYLGAYAFSGCGKLHAHIECARRTVGESTFETGQWITFTEGDRSFDLQLQNVLAAGSCEHALFAFAAERTEQRFIQMAIPEYCLPAAICYAESGDVFADYLRENIVSAVCMVIDRGDIELLRRVLGYGFLTERQTAECAAYAIEQKAFEQQVMIMRYKQDTFGAISDEALDSKFDW